MDAFTPCANLVSEDFGMKSDKSCCTLDLEPSCLERSYMRETAEGACEKKENSLPDAGKERLMTEEELGSALDEVVCIQDKDEKENLLQDIYKLGHREGLSNKSGWNPQKKMHQASGSISEIGKVLSKCATFPCSEKLLPSPLSVDRVGMQATSSMKPENAVCSRSNSLPIQTGLKLVSALKGGREQQGACLNSKLSVSWAPDVYDPPTSSLSHTVKGHSQHHRSKAKKKDHKHKHNKGKSTRGSSSSEKRQHVHKRSTGNTETLHLRFRASAASGDRILLGSCQEPIEVIAQSTTEVVEFAVINQDSKCRSSYLRESLGKVNLPFAEAT